MTECRPVITASVNRVLRLADREEAERVEAEQESVRVVFESGVPGLGREAAALAAGVCQEQAHGRALPIAFIVEGFGGEVVAGSAVEELGCLPVRAHQRVQEQPLLWLLRHLRVLYHQILSW